MTSKRSSSGSPLRLFFGNTTRLNPILAASRKRTAAWLVARISPASPTSPNTAVCSLIGMLRKLEVTAAYLARERAFAALGAARKARESSEAAYRATSALFRVGKATATELVVAEAGRVNARLEDVNARVDLRVAETRLRYALGITPPAR